MAKKALLVVSFGTSYEETRKMTIEALEKKLIQAFPDRTFYRAWTSGIIIKKVKKAQGLIVDTVEEAIERIKADGCTDLLVQPTHMLNGYENELMIQKVREAFSDLERLSIGAPLLDTEADLSFLADTILQNFSSLTEREALVLMGHGSPNEGNRVYGELRQLFAGRQPFVSLGTVEAEPDFSVVLSDIQDRKPERVVLAPLLIVAGDHATNDLAGDEEDSWKSRIAAQGVETETVLRGLGEYPEIQDRFVAHAKAAL